MRRRNWAVPLTAAAIVIAALALGAAGAQEATITFAIRSKNIEAEEGLALFSKPVAQTHLSTTIGKGFSVNLGHSTGFNRQFSSDWDDQLSYGAGWNKPLPHLIIETGVSYFDNFKLGHASEHDFLRTNLKISGREKEIFPTFHVSPFVNVSRFSVLETSTDMHDGNIYMGGLEYTKTFQKFRVSSETFMSWNDRVLEVEPGGMFKHSSIVRKALSKHLEGMLEVAMYAPFKRPGHTTFGAGFSWKIGGNPTHGEHE